ncbi:MAG: hypothetical protein U0944_03715 [Candidatus Moranbacteria bacterium]|nr:hypothetical protein [Candidatus Moranbacteria bacterium]
MLNLSEFWVKYEYKFVLAIGFILIAAISFEFGYTQGKNLKSNPIVIEKPAVGSENGPGCPVSAKPVSDTDITKKAPVEADLASLKKCAYVGSKNSDKFYPPSCSYAKRIKPENLVCFTTAQEALAQGRTESTGCK